MTLEHAYGL